MLFLAQIDDHDIDCTRAKLQHGLGRIDRLVDLVSFAREHARQQLPQCGILIEQENRRLRLRGARRFADFVAYFVAYFNDARGLRVRSTHHKPGTIVPKAAFAAADGSQQQERGQMIPKSGTARALNIAPAAFGTLHAPTSAVATDRYDQYLPHYAERPGDT
jgi:hypothetical protein